MSKEGKKGKGRDRNPDGYHAGGWVVIVDAAREKI